MHINLLWRERTVFAFDCIPFISHPFTPWADLFRSLDSLAHVNCLWLSLHVCTFPASFLWLTVALLSSWMACDTHLSQGNLCVPSCQVKQPFVHCWRPTQYLWDYKTRVLFFFFFFFFAFICTNLTKVPNTQSLNSQHYLLKHWEFILFPYVQTATIHF